VIMAQAVRTPTTPSTCTPATPSSSRFCQHDQYGENTTRLSPFRTFLESRGFPGYFGYNSDSEVFTHILHYAHRTLGFGIEAYKHVITPLQGRGHRTTPRRAIPAQSETDLPAAHH